MMYCSSDERFFSFIEDLECASDALGWDRLQKLVERRKRLVDIKNDATDRINEVNDILKEATRKNETSK